MEFRTPVAIEQPSRLLSLADGVLLVGSCFAQEIGNRLVESGFGAHVNPLGVMFNPASIARTLQRIADYVERGTAFTKADLFVNQDLWRTYDASSLLAAPTSEEALLKLNNALRRAADLVCGRQEATWLILTLGTNRTYCINNGPVVANCHKMPQQLFNERSLRVDEICSILGEIIGDFRRICPSLKQVVLTVSPYRYAKYGMHGNTLSKAALHLAIDSLQAKMGEIIDYFPAYEIVTDELRDYRFYAADMLHPSPVAIDYVWQRFVQTHIDPASLPDMAKAANACKQQQHRPIAL